MRKERIMLSQFSVKNFKSIKDEITLDMQATSISESSDHLLKTEGGNYLPVSVIYGPNGAGKSNVLDALRVLVNKVLRPVIITDSQNNSQMKSLTVQPFSFSQTTIEEPTEFEVMFITDVAEYKYSLSILKDKVVYERLDRVKFSTKRMSALFERNGNEIIKKGELSKLKVSEDISDTLPLLSYLGITYLNNEVVKDVFNWFKNKIRFLNYGDFLLEYMIWRNRAEGDLKDLIKKMIEELDLDIVDYSFEDKGEYDFDILTEHDVDGYKAKLHLYDESKGTQKLFSLLPHIADSLLNGVTLVIDEMDAKIHPLIIKYIIQRYTDKMINQSNAQLIFTSHDLSNMNSEVFRRDEIWFVAKGNYQDTQLYSLVEFKNSKGESVRKDAKYDKQYLEGKYGADPYLRRIIDWSEYNEKK